MPALNTLRLTGNFSLYNMLEVATLPALTNLTIIGDHCGGADGFSRLSELDALQQLSIGMCEFEHVNFEALGALTRLDLSGCSWPSEAGSLRGAVALQVLCLDGCAYGWNDPLWLRQQNTKVIELLQALPALWLLQLQFQACGGCPTGWASVIMLALGELKEALKDRAQIRQACGVDLELCSPEALLP